MLFHAPLGGGIIVLIIWRFFPSLVMLFFRQDVPCGDLWMHGAERGRKSCSGGIYGELLESVRDAGDLRVHEDIQYDRAGILAGD